MIMGQSKNAISVLRQAARLAKSPAEADAALSAMANPLRYDEQEIIGEQDQETKQ